MFKRHMEANYLLRALVQADPLQITSSSKIYAAILTESPQDLPSNVLVHHMLMHCMERDIGHTARALLDHTKWSIKSRSVYYTVAK